MAEEKEYDPMLVNERKVTKDGDVYVMDLHQKQQYPTEAVKTMLQSWHKAHAAHQGWLDSYEKQMATLIKRAEDELDAAASQLTAHIAGMQAKSKEEVIAILWDNYLKQIQTELEDLKKLPTHKQLAKEQIEEQFKNMKLHCEEELQKCKDGIDLWTIQ